MRRAASRVLAGIASLAVGGVFVAASALGALADSPSPATLQASVSGQTVTLSGTLEWGNNTGKCSSTNAGFGVVWGDTGDLGLPAPGDASKLVGLTGSPGGTSDHNLVQMVGAGCGVSATHTYVASLPSQVCIIGYHVSPGQTSKPFHSIYEADAAGQPGNTDNSILEPTKGGQQLVCAAIVKPLTDVALGITGTPSAVTAGDNITYTVTVGNTGSKAAAATDMTQHLKVTLDNNETFVSVTPGSGWTNCSNSGHVVTCDYAPVLNKGASAPPVTIVAKTVNNNETSVTTSAHVDNGDNSDDADTTNQDGNVNTPVTPPVVPPAQNISIDKTATPQVQVGQQITYQLTVTNKSTAATNDTIKVVDPLPAAVQFVSAAGNNWNCNSAQSLSCTWTGSPLASGASTSPIIVQATALQAAVPSVTNTAHALMGTIDVQDSATTIVNTPVNLTLTKSADPASGSDVQRGDEIVYTLHYANTGSTPATGAHIDDTIPAGTTFEAGSASCTTTCTPSFDGSAVHFALDLPAGSAGDATFTVKVNSDDVDGQVITNQASITWNGTTIPSNQTHHTVFVPSGDLTVTKAVSYTKPAKVGSVLTYTLTAAASGNITQHSVVITDAIPDGTTYKDGSATCSTGCTATLTNGVLSWPVGDMAPGSTQNVSFAVTVNGPAADGTIPLEIVNVGNIKSNETPQKPSNRVVVPLTTVLGTKIVKVTTPTTLPFTGLNTIQDALLAVVLIGGGLLLLTWPRLQPQSRRTV